MKNALISPITPVKEVDGVRIVQVDITRFDVAHPFFWIECTDDVVPDLFYYDTSTKEIKETPPEPEPDPQSDIQPEQVGAENF